MVKQYTESKCCFRIIKHKIALNKHKIALNRGDDERIVKADGITTLARGHVALSA